MLGLTQKRVVLLLELGGTDESGHDLSKTGLGFEEIQVSFIDHCLLGSWQLALHTFGLEQTHTGGLEIHACILLRAIENLNLRMRKLIPLNTLVAPVECFLFYAAQSLLTFLATPAFTLGTLA